MLCAFMILRQNQGIIFTSKDVNKARLPLMRDE